MYSKRNILRILLLAITCCCMAPKANAYCSLEKMKTYAMEACEHLFMQDEAREKRSIADGPNLINHLGYAKIYDKRHYVRRSIYPAGGYLKVGRNHYQKLSQVDVYPRYKAKKLHHEKNEKERFKREHGSNYSNLPYCCYNRCEEDFFC